MRRSSQATTISRRESDARDEEMLREGGAADNRMMFVELIRLSAARLVDFAGTVAGLRRDAEARSCCGIGWQRVAELRASDQVVRRYPPPTVQGERLKSPLRTRC